MISKLLKKLDIFSPPRADFKDKTVIGGVFSYTLLPLCIVAYVSYLIYQTVQKPEKSSTLTINSSASKLFYLNVTCSADVCFYKTQWNGITAGETLTDGNSAPECEELGCTYLAENEKATIPVCHSSDAKDGLIMFWKDDDRKYGFNVTG